MRIRYREINIGPGRLRVIQQANDIAERYSRMGLSLTLRQLYYQFVSLDLIPNRQQEYKRLGDIINDARYAGLFDWDLISDRTRNASGGDFGEDDDSHPETVINPRYFSVTQWVGQPHRVEVWVEKDALVDVIQRGAQGTRTVTFSCRGYTSSSEVWAAAQRIEAYYDDPAVEDVTIIHLGDHDPSGIDMTRDITDRLNEFLWGDGFNAVNVKRIALNMDQVLQYNPPPNPAKTTDSRYGRYIRSYGTESWELDALQPEVLMDLIGREVQQHIEPDLWEARRAMTARGQATLKAVRDNYDDIMAWLGENGKLPEVSADDAEDA